MWSSGAVVFRRHYLRSWGHALPPGRRAWLISAPVVRPPPTAGLPDTRPAANSVQIDEFFQGFWRSSNVCFHNHSTGHCIELIKLFRGFSTALVIQHALQMGDHEQSVIELQDAGFHVPGL
jgi:hypothetical protein